jgi:methylmalonyl-CoA mutase N-terminal domain/subunit
MGGAVEAIETGWMKREIEESAYRIALGIESGERVVVGVNKFAAPEEDPVEVLPLDPDLVRRQIERLERVRAERDQAAVDAALKSVEEAARGTDNLLYPMRDALAAYATLGEVSDALRRVFGEYEPEAVI